MTSLTTAANAVILAFDVGDDRALAFRIEDLREALQEHRAKGRERVGRHRARQHKYPHPAYWCVVDGCPGHYPEGMVKETVG